MRKKEVCVVVVGEMSAVIPNALENSKLFRTKMLKIQRFRIVRLGFSTVMGIFGAKTDNT
jgi:hypothetical protein